MNENFCERIAQLIEYYAEGKNTVFAKKIGVGEGNVRSWLSGTLPKLDVLAKIAKNCEKLDLYWLLTGEGSMLRTETPTETSAKPSDGADLGGIDVEKMLDTIATQARIIERLQLKIESLEAHQKQNEA